MVPNLIMEIKKTSPETEGLPMAALVRGVKLDYCAYVTNIDPHAKAKI